MRHTTDIWPTIEQLEAAARPDPQALLVLVDIYEQLLKGDLDTRRQAAIQKRLGTIFMDVPTGDRTANRQRAIVCFHEALRFWTPQTAPLDYAGIQNAPGTTYNSMPTADPATDVLQAIACYQPALRFLTPETAPHDCRSSNHALADLYPGHQHRERVLQT